MDIEGDAEPVLDAATLCWRDGDEGMRFSAAGALPISIEATSDLSALHDQIIDVSDTLSAEVMRAAPRVLMAFPFWGGQRHRRLAWMPERCLWRAPGGGWIETRSQPLDATHDISTTPSRWRSRAGDVGPPCATRRLDGDEVARSSWCSLVTEARAACREGRFEKVVVARSERHALCDGVLDISATFWALCAAHPGCTSFALRWPGEGAFIGATPETLVRVRGGRALTAALAGTLPSPDTAEGLQSAHDALLNSAKTRHEHEVVVEAILASLAEIAQRPRRAGAPRLRALSNVVHLETPIEASLTPDHTVLDAVAALHPTPAVGGAPRDAALDWLRAREGLDRGRYAAPLGWLDARGDGHFVVALRSARVEGGLVEAFAGAGITAGSVPEDEWEETRHKLQAVLTALRAQRDPETWTASSGESS